VIRLFWVTLQGNEFFGGISRDLTAVFPVCRDTKYREGSSLSSGIGVIPWDMGYNCSNTCHNLLDHSRNVPSVLKISRHRVSECTLVGVVRRPLLSEESRALQVEVIVDEAS